MRRFTLADGLLLLTILIWGLNVTVIKVLLGDFSPMALAVVRFTIVTAVFAAIVPVREGTVRVSRVHWGQMLAAGVCGIWLNQVAFTYGLANTTAANMTLLLTAIPIFGGLGAYLLGWERVGRRHWAGIAVGFVGVVLIVAGSPPDHGHRASLLGDGLALLTGASWAGYSLLLRPLMRAYSPMRISLWVGWLGLLPFGIPQLPAVHWSHVSVWTVLLILYSSVGSVVLTNFFWYNGIHKLGPSRTTVYSYLQPVSGLLFAVILLGEPVGVLQILGAAGIIGGVIFGREPTPALGSVE